MASAFPQLLPIELARDTVESLYAEHGGRCAWSYWLVLAGVAFSLGCLPFLKVDVSVRAAGMIRPATERAELRSPVSGHVARVLAHDNDRVRAGQPLLVLASRDLAERLARNRARQAGQSDLIFDLKLLTADSMEESDGGIPDPTLSPVEAPAGLNTALSPALFPGGGSADSTRGRSGPPGQAAPGSVPIPREAPPHAAENVSAFKTAALRREHAQLLAQLGSHRLDEARARNDYGRSATLAARGLASRSELDRARYEVERLQADSGLILQQALARWQLRLRDEEISLDELCSEEKRLGEEQSHFTICAPVEGLLIGFTGWSAGGFVSSGQLLGSVSPNDTLLVEAFIPPRDIGLVTLGQAAKIQVDAYPYTQWGLVDGTVVSVSGDSIGAGAPNSPLTPVFKVIVRPAATGLRLPGGARGELKKGLTVQARFLVARRSLFQLLYDDAGSWLDPSGPPRPGSPASRP